MAKTIRSHPTYHILVSGATFWTILIFSGVGPKMDLHFLHFPTSLHVKRLAPKGKKMRMDHPFILGFCQNVTFDMVFTIIFPLSGKTHFLKLLSYFNTFVYLRFNIGDPRLLLFQNKTLISKLEPYPYIPVI